MYLIILTAALASLIVWFGGAVLINSLGVHFFAISMLVFAGFVIYIEWSRKRLTLLSFPLVGSFLFIWGLYGPYYQLDVVGDYIYYSHLELEFMAQAMAFGLVCFSFLWLGYFFPTHHAGKTYNPVLIAQKTKMASYIVFCLFFMIWVVLSFIYIGGVSKLFYNDQPRAFDQFFLTNLRRNITLLIRFLPVILGFLSVTAFFNKNSGKLPVSSWSVLIFSFVYSLSQYDRGKFLEVAIVILGAYLISVSRLRLRQIYVLLAVGAMSAAILINANGRLYGKTGLLTIPEAVTFGVANKIKDPYSIFPEVGSLPMTTTAIKLRGEGVKSPISYVLYQINPMPSFLLPARWRPQHFMERLLGAFGSSGTPMPLMAFGYLTFGVWSALLFGLLGLYFRALSARIRYVARNAPVYVAAVGVIIYPVSLSGVMYTFAHGEPRGSIRMVLYAAVLLFLMRRISKNRFVRLAKLKFETKAVIDT